jgi:hypothetical protein
VRVTSFVPKGQVLTMPDHSHPETPMFDFSWGPNGLESSPAEIPDGTIVACHPDDERMVRDAIAIAQERNP